MKNTHPDEYKYSDCSIGFDSRSKLSNTDGSMRKNVTIFRADKNSAISNVVKKSEMHDATYSY